MGPRSVRIDLRNGLGARNFISLPHFKGYYKRGLDSSARCSNAYGERGGFPWFPMTGGMISNSCTWRQLTTLATYCKPISVPSSLKLVHKISAPVPELGC
jgi:hypothetical protein